MPNGDLTFCRHLLIQTVGLHNWLAIRRIVAEHETRKSLMAVLQALRLWFTTFWWRINGSKIVSMDAGHALDLWSNVIECQVRCYRKRRRVCSHPSRLRQTRWNAIR